MLQLYLSLFVAFTSAFDSIKSMRLLRNFSVFSFVQLHSAMRGVNPSVTDYVNYTKLEIMSKLIIFIRTFMLIRICAMSQQIFYHL